MELAEKQIPNEGTIRKVMKNEVVTVISIIMAVVTVFGVYKTMSDRQLVIENKLEYLEKNHLTHIEAAITEIRQEEAKESDKNDERDKTLIKILTMLEDHEKETQKQLNK